MKVDIVSLIFKMGDTEDVSNHCPISDFMFFKNHRKCNVQSSLKIDFKLMRKYSTHNSLFYEQSSLQNMQLPSLQIKFTNHL